MHRLKSGSSLSLCLFLSLYIKFKTPASQILL
jgi:hypothetical protein